MTVALLTIGTELLRGEVLDSNATWLADQLTQLGFEVTLIESVSDDREVLTERLKALRTTYPIVIVSGGLGPTTDDLTAESAAAAYDIKRQCNEDALATIKRRIEKRGIAFRAGHEKQALLPQGAELMANTTGTAPGFILRSEHSTAYFLPGVPREMKQMFLQQIDPRIRGTASNNTYQIRLRTYGADESDVAERLEDIEPRHPNVTLGYRASSPELDVKVFARATDYGQAREHAEAAARDVRERLGGQIYGEGDETMPQIASRAVRAKGWRLAAAESCTGGLIATLLTSQPASDYFAGSTVVYANNAKTSLLKVSEDTLRGHGAVSAEVAAEMAEGARRVFDSNVAISVTGIAGPTGATSDKPLGLCYWAVSHPGGTEVESKLFSGDRNQVQHKAAYAVLDLLRRTLRH